MRRSRLGLTILELVVAVCAIVIIVGVLIIPATTTCCSRGCGAKLLKDQTMIEQTHQAMLIWARENDGQYPLPGLIDRLPDPDTRINTPTTGPENVSLNHTAPLYSAMIAQNYFTPELVVGPTEPSPDVIVKDDYDYTAYNPAADSYWDTSFTARIDKAEPGSNTSYAHMALCGLGKYDLWRDTADPTIAMLSNRGPRNGATTGPPFADSMTLLIHGDVDTWIGHVVFADNHVQTLDSPEPPTLQQPNSPRPFNLFRMDGGALGISIASTEDTVTRIWDPLP